MEPAAGRGQGAGVAGCIDRADRRAGSGVIAGLLHVMLTPTAVLYVLVKL